MAHEGGVELLIGSSHRGFEGGDHLIKGNLFYKVGTKAAGYGPGVTIIYNPGNRTVVEGNTFHNCTFGIGIWNQNGNHISGVIIRNNRFHDMGRFEVDPWQVNTTTTAKRGSGGIHLTVPGGGHQIYNNVFYRNGPPASSPAYHRFFGVRVGLKADSTATTLIYNNTFYDFFSASSVSVVMDPDIPVDTVTVRNNIMFRAGAIEGGVTQSNNLLTDPMFVNAAGADFSLKPGSAAIDKGITLSPVVTSDFSGASRPFGGDFDIGAYEFGATSSSDSLPAAPSQFEVK